MLRSVVRHPQLMRLASSGSQVAPLTANLTCLQPEVCGCLITTRGLRSHLTSVPIDQAKYQAFTPTDSKQKHKKQGKKEGSLEKEKQEKLSQIAKKLAKPKQVSTPLEGLNVIVVDNLPKDTGLGAATEVLETFGKVVECALIEDGESCIINARMESRKDCEAVLTWFGDTDGNFPGIEGRKVGCHLKFSPA